MKKLLELINDHPLPWYIERDWTWEVYDANKCIIMKYQLLLHAETLVALANYINDKRNK